MCPALVEHNFIIHWDENAQTMWSPAQNLRPIGFAVFRYLNKQTKSRFLGLQIGMVAIPPSVESSAVYCLVLN